MAVTLVGFLVKVCIKRIALTCFDGFNFQFTLFSKYGSNLGLPGV